MTWQVRVRPEAELDLWLAARWYEAQQPGLGTEYLRELSDLVFSLDTSALLHAVVMPGTRRALAYRFPYAVYYRIMEPDVIVLSVLHQRMQARV